MRKIISILLALGLLCSAQYIFADTAYAQNSSTPEIRIEISDYISDGVFGERSGRDKLSATAGEKIVITFILSGIDSIECYQLSGNYDTSKLSAGYFSEQTWNTGDEEQDFDTIIAGSDNYSDNAFDDSFSFTRTVEEPYICLVGFSLTGSVQLQQETKLISVGFKVLDDIDNIYRLFSWDESTMVAVSVDEEEYYTDSGLYIGCNHEFEGRAVAPNCTEDGYYGYFCKYCYEVYKTDYVSALGHNATFIEYDGNAYIFHCSACECDVVKSSEDLISLWRAEYINSQPLRNTDLQYLDVNPDNVINAKDYAEINNHIENTES